jgi:hypothetical protein
MTSGGPRITTDNLVLCLDAHDAKSYPGEPTDNKQPNDASSRFTSSNTWGTYQTNQYNGNTYFSIGTISSVSGNVVTTSSNHPLRTYDAVRAQTSGGGITAGTHYFIKKLSNTTFTIHAYNSSQNGTQGYIRSDGYHQVHESIATDTRISVNATSFPTMWHGAPHLPNTAHVKELRIGGGPKRGTNAMRIHVTRTVGVDGGMSYGVNVAGATQGDTVTSSWWARSSLPSKSVTYYTYWGATAADAIAFTPTQKWQKFTHTWTASGTYTFIQYWFQGADSAPWWFEVADLQTEINKSYSTPYVLAATDRSTTDAWKDGTGGISNLIFNGGVNTGVSHYRKGQVIEPKSNAYIDFDGTDDYIRGAQPSGQVGSTTAKTYEYWFKMNSGFGSGVLIMQSTDTNSYNWQYVYVHSNGSLQFHYGPTNAAGYNLYGGTAAGTITADVWICIAISIDVSRATATDRIQIYKNAEAVSVSWNGTYTNKNAFYDGTDMRLYIGAWNHANPPSPSTFFDGQMGRVSIWKTGLTAQQVEANFNAHRGRYGI